MLLKNIIMNIVCAALWMGCGESHSTSSVRNAYRGYHAFTLQMGAQDNSEVVKALPNQPWVVLVASKTRKVSLLEIVGDTLVERRSRVLFQDDPSENELTHIDFSSDASFAVVTRTLAVLDGDNNQTACEGEIVFIDVSDSEAFGTVLKQVPVGAMPDSVDISNNDQWVVVANERDAVALYGKCTVPSARPSVSLVSLANGVALAQEVKRIAITVNHENREPENVRFAKDNDTVAVTLQDSQELMVFSAQHIAALDSPTQDDTTLTIVPSNMLGDLPWPDGVMNFVANNGAEYFATANEYNDTFSIFTLQGELVQNIEIHGNDISSEFPRAGYPAFRPDSVTTLRYQHGTYLAFSLKNAGAVGVWDVSDTANVRFASAVKVGNRQETAQEESEVGPEGITATASGAIVTANEKESSVSLVVPEL